MRSLKIIFSILLISGLSVGCVQFGKVVGKFLTSSTSDLNESSTQIRYVRNTYNPEVKTTEVSYFKDWNAGRNMVGLNSFKREGAGMLKIDGTVKSNGNEIPYIANGAYAEFVDDLSPQTIDIETVSGQQISFTVSPIEEVKIKSVNGGSGEIDLSKDLVLEFNEPAQSENPNMRAMLLMDFMGTRSFADIANFKAADKVVIPAEAFKHLPGLNPITGDSYLMIERYKVTPHTSGGIGAAQILSLSWDTVPVKVSNNVKQINGLPVKNTIEDENGTFTYNASKPNAFLGKPFSKGKKFALTSLTVRATKLQQSRSESSSSTAYYSSYSVKTTTTTTETRAFPKLPEVFWDNLLNSMYTDVTATLQNNFDIEFIPVEEVLKAPSYAKLKPIEDGITQVEVSKSYKGTKPLLPTTFSAIMGSISTTFASDRIDARLLNELGVDGLIAITIDLEMPWEEFSLSPRMSFRITGAPNGYLYGPTVFAEGVIHGNGIELDEVNQEEVNIELLNQIVRKDALISAFDDALRALKAEESKHGYEQIWALQD
ncbi:MAG: hypothetical protein WD016_11610 [Balneolaceae bacterium]